MPAEYTGERHWSMSRDVEGNREYKLQSLIAVDKGEGPYTALLCEDLPQPGSIWNILDDVDEHAYCLQTANVTPYSKESDPTLYFLVEQTFSTKCTDRRCMVEYIGDPVASIPPRISGGSVKYTEEATNDINGDRILNSAHEPIRGPQNEWDRCRTSVTIVQNVYDLELALCQSLVNSVNYDPMWGQGPRCVKLSEFTWEKKSCGDCLIYFERKFVFDIESRFYGWDRQILDEGTRVLHGEWNRTTGLFDRTVPQGSAGTLNPNLAGVLNPALPLLPNPADPSHFIEYKDKKNNHVRVIYAEPEANGIKGVPFVDPVTREKKFWCLSFPGGNRAVFHEYCSEIKAFAADLGCFVKGPYDTEGAANTACQNPFAIGVEADITSPLDLVCGSGATQPNTILVQYYPAVDFEALLQLPSDLTAGV